MRSSWNKHWKQTEEKREVAKDLHEGRHIKDYSMTQPFYINDKRKFRDKVFFVIFFFYCGQFAFLFFICFRVSGQKQLLFH